MFSFNLVDEEWLPVVPLDGATQNVGAREALVRAHEWRELYDDSPLITVTSLRVLLAMLQRCWRTKTKRERSREWRGLWEQGRFDADAINAYLDKWRDRFDLISETHPFMQTAELSMDEASGVRRLAFEENNTSGIFAHGASPDWTAPSPGLVARLVLATQGFALGFGKSSKAKIAGQEIDPPYSADANLLRGVTLWLSGRTLFETLMLNLVPADEDPEDKPSWELDAPHTLRDELVNGKRRTHAPRGPLDRFTWHSRLLRLLPSEENGQIVVRAVYFTQGRSLDREILGFEPMKAYVRNKKEGYSPVSLSEGKAAWRDAHALFNPGDNGRRIEAFNWVGALVNQYVLPPSALYDLHVVGVASDPGKAGKFLLWRHDRMPAPAALLQNPELAGAVRQAAEDAEAVASALNDRMRMVARRFLAPESGSSEGRQPHPDDITRLVKSFDPRRAFWPRLEPHFHNFLLALRTPENKETALEKWRDAVQDEARRCFREATRALGTSPRAIRAVAEFPDGFLTPQRLEAYKAERKQREQERKKAVKATRKEVIA